MFNVSPVSALRAPDVYGVVSEPVTVLQPAGLGEGEVAVGEGEVAVGMREAEGLPKDLSSART